METRAYNNNLLASLLSQSSAQNNANGHNQTDNQKKALPSKGDSIQLSQKSQTTAILNQTRLISETTEAIDNGIRRIQVFEKSDGRQFTKIEEIITNEKQSRRTVIQQNASGSTSVLEDVFDRQKDGSFRLTQRYTNEVGETSVNIDPNAKPPNTDFILGRPPAIDIPSPPNTERGREINVVI